MTPAAWLLWKPSPAFAYTSVCFQGPATTDPRGRPPRPGIGGAVTRHAHAEDVDACVGRQFHRARPCGDDAAVRDRATARQPPVRLSQLVAVCGLVRPERKVREQTEVVVARERAGIEQPIAQAPENPHEFR